MKPIMFESLRNLLKSRSGKSGKHKDKGGVDASFKRSDSFKRISIRKSYLDRGRNKRLAAQQKLSQAAASAASQQGGGAASGEASTSLIDLDDINNVTTTKQLQLQQRHFVASHNNNSHNHSSNSKNGSSRKHTKGSAGATADGAAHELCGDSSAGGNRIGGVDASSIEHRQPANKCRQNGGGRPKTSLEEITEILSFDKSPRSQRRNNDWGGEPPVRKEVEVQTVRMDFDRSEASRASQTHSIVVVDVFTDALPVLGAQQKLPKTRSVYDQSNAVRLREERKQLNGSELHTGNEGSVKYVNSLYLTGNETVSSIESSNGQHNDRSLQSLLEDTSIEVVKRVAGRYSENVEFERISERSSTAETEEDKEGGEVFVDSIEQMPSLVTFKTFLQSKEFSAPTQMPTTTTLGNPKASSAELNVSRTQVIYEQPINSSTFKITDPAKKKAKVSAGQGQGQDIKAPVGGDVSIVIKVPYTETVQPTELDRIDNAADRAAECIGHQMRARDDSVHSSDETDSSTVCDDTEEKDREQTSNYVSTYEINLDYPSYLGNIDEDIISSDGNMPYPLRMKTNPFTHQKELYAVNLGRIWKQLNLGQHDEDFSIDSLKTAEDPAQQPPPPPPLTPQLVTTSTGGKPFNNESFKSMSSRDSGFSLTTLTKSESLFRRRSRKAKDTSLSKGPLPFQKNKKPKLSVSRDGYFKRVMIQQKNSTKRKKQKQRAKLPPRHHLDPNVGGLLLQDFEEFCKQKALAAALGGGSLGSDTVLGGTTNTTTNTATTTGGGGDDDGESSTVTSEDSFKKEMRELEAFYEAHLLRLKDYYLKRKELNEATITDFYNEYKRTYFNRQGGGPMLLMRDYTQMQREVESQLDHMDIYSSPYIMARNETLRRKISLDQQERMLSSSGGSLSGHGSRFSFPHPDKRKRLTTSTESLANQFSRFTRRNMFSQQSNSNTSATSTRSQPIPRFSELRPQLGLDDDLKYAELVFQNNSFNSQQLLQQSSPPPFGSMPPIITPPTPFRRGFPHYFDEQGTRKLSRKDRNFFFKNIRRFMHMDPSSTFLRPHDVKASGYVDDPFVSLLSGEHEAGKHEILLSSVFPSVVTPDGEGAGGGGGGGDRRQAASRRHHDDDDGDAYPNGDQKNADDDDSIHTIDANSCDFCFNFKHFCDISSDKGTTANRRDGGGLRTDDDDEQSVLDFQSTMSHNCNCNFLLRSKRKKKKKKGHKFIAEAGDDHSTIAAGRGGVGGDDVTLDEEEEDDDDGEGDSSEVFEGLEEWFDYENAVNGDVGGSEGGRLGVVVGSKVKRRRSKKKLKKRKSTVRRMGKTIMMVTVGDRGIYGCGSRFQLLFAFKI